VKTNYRGAVGCFPIHHLAICINCKETLSKKHGLNPQRDGGPPTVMGWFLFDTGPRCIHCHKEAWMDAEFQKRTGSSEYSAKRWDLDWAFRPKEQ
jgi:hypothetical protein